MLGYDFSYAGLTMMNPFLLGAIVVWALLWKGLALWHSARGKQKIWFVIVLITNTLGILPIIYLLFFRRRKFVIKPKPVKKIKKKKKKR